MNVWENSEQPELHRGPDSNFLLSKSSRGSMDWEWKESDSSRVLFPSQRPAGVDKNQL